MHLQNQHPTAIVLTSCLLVGCMLSGPGCRNTLPDRQVRLQSRPDTGQDGIEEPPSRLYSAFGLGRSKSSNRQPAIEAQASANQARGGNPRSVNNSMVRQVSGDTHGTSFSFSDSADPQSDAQPLTREEQEMLMEAFEDASPEIRQLAERRISSLKAQAARSTSAGPTSTTANTASNNDFQNQLDGTNERFPTLDRETDRPLSSDLVSKNSAINPTTTAAEPNAENLTKQAKADPDTFAMPDLSSTTNSITTSSEKTEPEQATASTQESPVTNVTSLANITEANSIETTLDKVSENDKTTENDTEPEIEPQPNSSQPIRNIADSLATASDQQLLQELIQRQDQRLQEALKSNQPALNDIIRLRTYRLFAGGLEQATQPVEGWSTSEQEFLNYQTLALWHLIDPASHPLRERRWATALPELRQATNHLAASTGNLHVHNLAFCTAVDGYGKVTPFASSRFTAGQQVILYSEVENFVAERLSDGYETHLRGTYRILDSTGRRVAEQVLAEDQQTCTNYRRDYFLPYILHLPDRLSAGNYRFELTLEDVKGKKFGQASIPFEIIATGQ